MLKFLSIPGLCFTLLGVSAAPALAEYPDRVIKLVVTSPAGGGVDIPARVIVQKLKEILPQPVIVENRPGGAQQIGAEHVFGSDPDGYTLLFCSSTSLTLPYLRKTKFDLPKDFVPLAQIATGNFAFVVSPKLPINSLADFLALARKDPGKYKFGSAGVGGSGHLAGELLKSKAGVNLTHVPYKSSPEIAQGLMIGDIDFAIDIVQVQKPLIDSGSIRALATTGPARDPGLPDLKTVNELGDVPGGYTLVFWYGAFARAGTPQPIVDKLRQAFEQATHDPKVIDQLSKLSLQPSKLTPDQFQADMESEAARWKKVIQDAKIEAKD